MSLAQTLNIQCWSTASFYQTSGLPGRVHRLNNGTLNTAPRLFPTGLMVIPFRIHIQGSSSGNSARSNVSLTNSNYIKSHPLGLQCETCSTKQTSKPKTELNPNKSMCWQCCTTARMTTCGSRIPCCEEKSDANWLTQLLNNGEWFHTKSWCCGQNVKGKTHMQDW